MTRVVRSGRGAELALVLLALGISAAAYASVGLNRTGRVETARVWPFAGLAVLVLVAHGVIRARLPWADPVLLPAATVLNGLGLVLIHVLDDIAATSATAAGHLAPRRVADTQLVWTALGIVLAIAVVVAVGDHRVLERVTYLSGASAVVLLALPLVPGLGVRIFGARIWIAVAGLSFQPGEVAKVALAVFFAGYLAATRDALAVAGRRVVGIDLPRARDLGPIVAVWLLSVGVLVFEQGLGISLLLFGLFVVMLYVATQRVSWVVLGAALFAGGAAYAYHRYSYVRERFDVWLHPFAAHNVDAGYQVVQSLFGMANGGLLGTGLGLGQPQMVPLAQSDFIAATLGENLGLTGLVAVILLYGLLIERGLRTALMCRDAFSTSTSPCWLSSRSPSTHAVTPLPPTVLVVAAAQVKITAAVVLFLLAADLAGGHRSRGRWVRGAGVLIGGAAVFAAITVGTGLGFGWLNALSVPGRGGNAMTPVNALQDLVHRLGLGAHPLDNHVLPAPGGLRAAGLLVGASIVTWAVLSVRRLGVPLAAAASLAAQAAFGTSTWPWYFGPVLALVAVAAPSRRVLTAVILGSVALAITLRPGSEPLLPHARLIGDVGTLALLAGILTVLTLVGARPRSASGALGPV